MPERALPVAILAVVELDTVLVVCLAIAVGSAHIVVAVLGEVSQGEAMGFLLVVCVNQAFTIAIQAADAVSRRVTATPGLHAQASLKAGYHIGTSGIGSSSASNQLVAVGVASREVQQIDAGESDQEAADQGEGIDGIGRVKAAEEDKRRAEGGGSEGDVV